MLTLKGNLMAKKVFLSCVQCGSRTYTVPTSKEGFSERLELKKFCTHCKAHMVHKQTL
jgi:large subunit ribosomal protein L33